MSNAMKQAIAAVAARWVVEEGLAYGPAKQKAVREMGLSSRQALPDNDLLEAEVMAYLQCFHADTQPAQLRALREHALTWMVRLQAFRPHLSGAVWRGTATHHSDIHLQLFCDDSKQAEWALLDQGVRFDVSEVNGFRGEKVAALSIQSFCPGLAETVGVHLMVHDHDDLRGGLLPDKQGRTDRGDTAALRQLLDNAA